MDRLRVHLTAAFHRCDIRAVFERLGEVADVADNIGVALERQGDDRNPTKREPRMALDDVASHVAAVVALADHALVTLDGLAEGVLAAHEEEEHVGRVQWL